MALTLFEQRAGLDQLRIQPVNAESVGTGLLVGYVTAVAATNLLQGESFSVNDGVNNKTTFFFDKNAAITATAIYKVVPLDGSETIAQVAQLMIAAINDASLNVTVENWGSGKIRLENTVIGNGISLSATVGNSGFIIESSSINQYVFCLGSDLELPPAENYAIGDKVGIGQDIVLTSGTKLLRIQGRFRQPASMLTREALPSSPSSTTITRYVRSGVNDTTEITSPTNFFSSADDARSIYLTGAGVSGGTYKVFRGGYKYDSATDTYIAEAKSAILFGNEPLAAPGGPTNITGYVLGAHWKVNVKLEGIIVFAYDPGQDGLKKRDILLPDLTVNVSKFTGTRNVQYEFELAETT